MPAAWSKKRERQYEHVKEGLERRGESDELAEEIAARTVNKERARSGESQHASKSSTSDISSGRRGGLRSHKGPGGRTRDQLYAEACSVRNRRTLEDEQAATAESGGQVGTVKCIRPHERRSSTSEHESEAVMNRIIGVQDR